MARPKSDAREQLVGQLVDIFYEFGYDGTTLALITERTGFGRASLYHHFPGGKDEMACAVLQQASTWFNTHLAARLAQESTPIERLRVFMQAHDDVHYRARQLTPANAFGVGEGLSRFGEALQAGYRECEGLLASLLVDCGLTKETATRRAQEATILMEGALVCSRIANDLALYRGIMQRLPHLMLAPENDPSLLPATQCN